MITKGKAVLLRSDGFPLDIKVQGGRLTVAAADTFETITLPVQAYPFSAFTSATIKNQLTATQVSASYISVLSSPEATMRWVAFCK